MERCDRICHDERMTETSAANRTGEGEPNRCGLCGMDRLLSKHHLIPRAMHGKKRFRKRYSMQEMRDRGIMLCRLCHTAVHTLFSEKELGERLNTKTTLAADDRIRRHVNWARKRR